MADYEDVGVIAVVHWRTKLIDSLVARRLFPILVFGVFHFWFSVHFFVVALRPFLHLRFLSLRWPVFFFLNFSRGPSTVLLCVCVCVCVCVCWLPVEMFQLHAGRGANGLFIGALGPFQ